MSKKYYWLKLKEDFFRQKEIKKLRKIAGGDTYTIIYLKMQLLSLQNEGVLKYEGVEENIAEQIALEIDEDVDNVQITLSFLMANKLIEEISKTDFFLVKANDCIGKEVDSAARVRAYRERKKQEEKRIEEEKNKLLQCNGDVTKSNTEKEIDIEKEKEKDKDIDKDTINSISSTEVQQIINTWNSLGLQNIKFIKNNTNRYKMLNARIKEYGIDTFLQAINNIRNSSFLKGQNNRNWTITFDWLIKPNNFIKVLEGNYDDKENKGGFNNESRSNTSKDNEPSKGKSKDEHDAEYWKEQNRILDEMLDSYLQM